MANIMCYVSNLSLWYETKRLDWKWIIALAAEHDREERKEQLLLKPYVLYREMKF